MEKTITPMEAMADVIVSLPKFTEAAEFYGSNLTTLIEPFLVNLTKQSLSEYEAEVALTITAANKIMMNMNGHLMFTPKVDTKGTNVMAFEGFDCWNRSCGLFTKREALACALIMIHGNLGMFDLSMEQGMVISTFKYSDPKFAQILD